MEFPVESVATTTNEKPPICVGIPLIAPPGDNARPGGSVAPNASDHVTGPFPPAACNGCKYATPTPAFPSALDTIDIGLTERENVRAPTLPTESTASSVNVYDPVRNDVPPRNQLVVEPPVSELPDRSVNPGGSAVFAVTVYGGVPPLSPRSFVNDDPLLKVPRFEPRPKFTVVPVGLTMLKVTEVVFELPASSVSRICVEKEPVLAGDPLTRPVGSSTRPGGIGLRFVQV